MFKKSSVKEKDKRNYYFIPQCPLSRIIISEIQKCLARLCANDTCVIQLSFSESYSLPERCKAYEIPISKPCRSATDLCKVENEILSKLSISGAYNELAEEIYCDSDIGLISEMPLLLMFTDHCPKSGGDGLLIVWSCM